MTEAPRRLFEITDQGDVTVARIIESRVVTEEEIQQFGEQLGELVAAPVRKLLIDFGNVRFMSSAALGKLVSLKKKIRDVQGQLKLCRIDPTLLEVFRITRLDTVFEIHKDVPSALARF